MKSYHIQAVDQGGKTIEDIIAAEDAQELAQIIKSRSLYLLEYKEGVSTSDSITKLPLKSLVIFCRQLGTMVLFWYSNRSSFGYASSESRQQESSSDLP